MYPNDRRYSKEHEWIRVADGTGTVGITQFAQEQLGDIVYVELPEQGRKVTRGDVLGTIELWNVGIFGITDGTSSPGVDSIRTIKAEMYVERVSFETKG